jgi:hypothetical protein
MDALPLVAWLAALRGVLFAQKVRLRNTGGGEILVSSRLQASFILRL